MNIRMALLRTLLMLAATTSFTLPTACARVTDEQVKACNPDIAICGLSDSGPIVATHDGQIIESVRIKAIHQPGILVHGLSNVVIRNVQIFHDSADGISCEDAPGLLIENVDIIYVGSPTNSSEENNISCYRSNDLIVRNTRLKGGSSGLYVLESSNVHLSYIDGHNFKGPDPRGQFVQFDKSPNCLLEDFSARNDPEVSRTADNVSIYRSDDCIVRRGFLDGNNGPWTVGVMFEHSRRGLVEDVDTVAQGNGSFSAYPGHDITFRRTRARDNICEDQGRGKPSSNALVWAGSSDSTGLRLEASTYYNLCNPNKRVWDRKSFDEIQITEEDFSPRPAITLKFPWENYAPTVLSP